MPKKHTRDRQVAAKLSLTLAPDTADEVKALAEMNGMTLAQVVRSALGLYQFVEKLTDDEELCVRHKETGEITRLAIVRS
jgi:hypothetical protein